MSENNMSNSLNGSIAAKNAVFQDRIKFLMQKSAVSVIGEVGTTPGHTERLAYAKTVLDGTASVFEMAVATTTNATVLAAIGVNPDNATDPLTVTDSDLEFTVNGLWDDFSGYEAP